jgi:hypothetical protein
MDGWHWSRTERRPVGCPLPPPTLGPRAVLAAAGLGLGLAAAAAVDIADDSRPVPVPVPVPMRLGVHQLHA